MILDSIFTLIFEHVNLTAVTLCPHTVILFSHLSSLAIKLTGRGGEIVHPLVKH
jgi:hypothetical protein